MSTYADGLGVQPPAEDEHALVGAYALNAVDPAERAEFEVHLAACPLCSADVPAFREVIARMALDAQAPPPPDLLQRTVVRARMMQQVRPAGLIARILRRLSRGGKGRRG